MSDPLGLLKKQRMTTPLCDLPSVTVVANETAGIGGMERQLRELIERLLDAGTSVTVVSRSLGVQPHERLRFQRVPGPGRPFSLMFPWFVVFSTVRLLRARGLVHTTGAITLARADVVTVHYLHTRPGVAQLNRARRATLAYRLNDRIAGVLSRALERLVLRSAERSRVLVAVSETLGDELASAFPDRKDDIRVIGNGVDAGTFRPDPRARADVRSELGVADQCLAVFVGGDWERKGLGHAVDALREADGWHLAVVGPGDVENLRLRARRIGVEDRLRIVGPSDEPERYLAAADALVLPSAYETFSLVALEAAAAGVPVVAPPVGVVPELARAGGAIVTAAVPSDIGDALRRLERHADQRHDLGRAGRRFALERTWDAVADAYGALYECVRVDADRRGGHAPSSRVWSR
jgi:UDP-glucose:(heptosyl)LPS alpha-1,3-glucosyltransferase